jgi:hypothetical protein
MDETPERALSRALGEARARGEALKERLLSDPEMLNVADMVQARHVRGRTRSQTEKSRNPGS